MSTKPDFPDFEPTMPGLIKHAVAEHGDREWTVLGNRRLTFRDADRESAEIAKGLLAAGIGKGSRVGIVMPNSPDWLTSFWAVGRMGGFAVVLSTLYQAKELLWSIKHADIDTLLIVDKFMNNDYIERLERAIPELKDQSGSELFLPDVPYLRRIFVYGECDRAWAAGGLNELKKMGEDNPQIDDEFLQQVESNVAPADLLTMIYTSGSTSEPKAVMHTHGTAVRHGNVLCNFYKMEMDTRCFSAMPFFWIGGMHNVMMSPIVGACIVCGNSTKADDILDVAEKERVNRISAWKPQFEAIAELLPNRKGEFLFMKDRHSMPIGENGEPVPANRIPNSLGMTETFGPHSCEWTKNALPEDKVGSFGRGMAQVDRKIVDPKTGKEVGVNEKGELHIRGYSVMQSFYKKEREECFDFEGYYNTGDNGRIDADGHLYFLGRSGEMMKTLSGANVAPREVELFLETYEDVKEAGILGIPEGDKGDRVIAVVILADGFEADAEELRLRLKGDISAYKVPEKVFILNHEDIPRTDSGKLQKPRLKKIILELLAKQAA